MKKSTKNQQPLKGSKKWIKKFFIFTIKAFKLLYRLSKIIDYIKNFFDDNP